MRNINKRTKVLSLKGGQYEGANKAVKQSIHMTYMGLSNRKEKQQHVYVYISF